MTDESTASKPVAFCEGLFVMPPGEGAPGYLIGSRCRRCGEVFFPKRETCGKCLKDDLEEIRLSRRGKLASFTVIRHKPPAPFKAPEPFSPFALGEIDLPEGLAVLSQLTGCDVDSMTTGIDVELTFEKQYEDAEGNDAILYKFRPV